MNNVFVITENVCEVCATMGVMENSVELDYCSFARVLSRNVRVTNLGNT